MAVAYAVGKHEVPSGSHKDGDISSDLAVATVGPLTRRSPWLLEGPSGMVHGAHLHLEVVDTGLKELGDIHGVACECPERCRNDHSVQLDLAVVVDPLGTKPDGLFRPVLGNRHLRAVCRRVEVSRTKSHVGNLPFLNLVVKSPIRIWHDAVLDERRKHCSRHYGRHPLPGRGLLRHLPRTRSRQRIAPLSQII